MPDDRGHIDSEALQRSVSALRSAFETTALEDALTELLEASCRLFAITGTGLMAVDENRGLSYLAATDEPGRLLEELQERVGRGPCVDALVYDRVVISEDLPADDRWPELSEKLREHSVRGLLGVPVHVNGTAIGSLNGYVDKPYAWDASEIQALQTYADLVGRLLASAIQAHARGQLVEQLQHALDSRVVIERAVGMVMGRDGIDAVTAYGRLRSVARARRERVSELAERVLAGAPLDDPPDPA